MRARGPSTRRAYPSGIVPWTAWHVVQLSRRSLQRVRAYRLRIQSAEFDVQGHVRRDRRCSHSAGNGRGARRGSTAARSSRGRADSYARRRLPHKARRLGLRARTRIVRVHTQRYAAHVAEHREPASAVLRDDHAGRNDVRGVLPALRGSCLWTSAAWTRSHVSLPRQERSRCWVRRSRPPIRSDERRDLDTPECIRKHWRSSVSFRLDVPRTRDGAARLGPGLAAPPCPFRGSCGRPAG